MVRRMLLVALATLLLAAPGLALADTGDAPAPSAATGDRALPLSGTATLENAVGLGTFFDNPDTGQMKMPYYALLLSLTGAWALTDELSLRGRFDLEQEVTSSYATQTEGRHRLSPSDVWLGLAHTRLLVERWLTGVQLEGDLRAYLPTSYESRYATRYLGLSARLGATRRLGGFDFSLGTRATRYLQRQDHPVVPVEEQQAGLRPCIGQAVDGGTACGGMASVQTALTHDFTIGYDLTRTLTASATLMVLNRFAPASELDERSSPYATTENQRDLTWGLVDLTYQLNEHVAYSLGVSSLQPARSADGRALRFPFWSTAGRAENYTSFYLDVQGSF